jgi:O-antigen/teichoic acid export membrane protein
VSKSKTAILSKLSKVLEIFRGLLKGKSAVYSMIQIFLNQGGVFVIGFFSSVILARVLGPQERGLFAELLVYPALVASFLQMGVRQSVVFETGRGFYSVQDLVSNVFSLMLIFAPVGVCIAAGLILFSSPNNHSYTEVLLAVVPLAFILIKTYAGGLFLGQQRIGQFNNTELLPSLFRLFGILLLVWLMPFGVAGALFANLISTIIASYYVVHLIVKEVRIVPTWDWCIIKALLSRGIVFALAILLTQLNYKLDIVILGHLAPPEEVGFYSVAVAIPMLIWQIPSAVGLVIFSRRANVGENREFGAKVRKGMVLCIGLGFFVAVLLYIAAPFLVPLIYGDGYKASITMFQLILPGIVGMIGYKILGFDFAGLGRPWLPVLITAPGLIVNLGLNLLWIPEYGGNGAAMASAVSYVLMLVISMVIFYKVSNSRKGKVAEI